MISFVLFFLIQKVFFQANSSITKKIIFGYQGWFNAPIPAGGNWVWTGGASPNSADVTFDLWPDVAEYIPDSAKYRREIRSHS